MGTIQIPAKTIHKCDGCKIEVEGKNKPNYWTKVIHFRDAYDMQGNACAADNINLLFCNTCTKAFSNAVNKEFNRED